MKYIIMDNYSQFLCGCENIAEAEELTMALTYDKMYEMFLWSVNYNNSSIQDSIRFANAFTSSHYIRAVYFI